MPETQENRTHTNTTCAFCRIIQGEEKAAMMFEDDLSLAFLVGHLPAAMALSIRLYNRLLVVSRFTKSETCQCQIHILLHIIANTA